MTVGGERKIFFCNSSVADGSRLANAFLLKDLPTQSPVSNSVGSVAANFAVPWALMTIISLCQSEFRKFSVMSHRCRLRISYRQSC